MTSKKTDSPKGSERRKSIRRPIVESFAFFVAIPRQGGYRLPIQDLSEEGIAFDLDAEGASLSDFPIQSGEGLEVHFYLNQSFFIPLQVKLVRLIEINGVRKAGALFLDKKSKPYQALMAVIQMLDRVSEAGQVTSGS